MPNTRRNKKTWADQSRVGRAPGTGQEARALARAKEQMRRKQAAEKRASK